MGQTCGCAEYGTTGEKEEVLAHAAPKLNTQPKATSQSNSKEDGKQSYQSKTTE